MNQQNLIETLNNVLSGLKLDATCISVTENKHMSFYDISLRSGCRVKKIENFAPEIALALRSRTEPIVKSIPSKGIVRLHVATKDADKIELNSIYNYNEAPKDAFIPFLLGENDEGKKLWTDMSKNPHMLVAGSTGSGKSVFLHVLISNINKLRAAGENIDLYLSDPKRVEFNRYDNQPTENGNTFIASTYDDTVRMIRIIESIMEQRYALMCKMQISKIEESENMFSKIFVIIDEVADLMMLDKKHKTFETLITRLAQKSRASGIYLILATQRSSVDVLSGTIKANFPARVAFKVSSIVDSRVILDRSGASGLLGCGDGLLCNYDNELVRFQSAYVE